MEEKIEEKLMSNEEFEKYLEEHRRLGTYEGVGRYRSIWRAMRRGHVTSSGILIPKRPFHNKANTCKRKGSHSRELNETKKEIYAGIKQARASD